MRYDSSLEGFSKNVNIITMRTEASFPAVTAFVKQELTSHWNGNHTIRRLIIPNHGPTLWRMMSCRQWSHSIGPMASNQNSLIPLVALLVNFVVVFELFRCLRFPCSAQPHVPETMTNTATEGIVYWQEAGIIIFSNS